MYLLDTEVFEDLVLGDLDDSHCAAVSQFVDQAERRQLRVGASVISVAMLRYDVSNLEAGPDRTNWEKRLSKAVARLTMKTALYDVDMQTADTWAMIKPVTLLDADGDDMGDDQRMVLASAVRHGLLLITRDRGLYQPVIDSLGLQIEDI